MKTWDEAYEYVSESGLQFGATQLSEFNSNRYPKDAFSLGQLASKAWLVDTISKYAMLKDQIVLLGSWIGIPAHTLLKTHGIDRVWGVDSDPDCSILSDKFNRHLSKDWQYKSVVADACCIDWSQAEFVVEDQLINIRPSAVINTSAEHMNDDWFFTCGFDQLVAIQSNDNPYLDGHINVVTGLDHMLQKYPMRTVVYSGVLQFPEYTRYMAVGYPNL